MSDQELACDVVIVGAGNAALSAAHAAAERGATVRVLEKAPKAERGGNSALTGHLRFAYDCVDDLLALMAPKYSTDEVRTRLEKSLPRRTREDLWNEIMATTGGASDPELVKVHVDESYPTVTWLHSLGHNWVAANTTAVTGNIVRCEGAGFGLQQRNFARLERNDRVSLHYQTAAQELLLDGAGKVIGVRALSPSGPASFRAGAVVLASGGFEANPEMRARYLGPLWDNLHIRGVPYNTGDGLRMALEIGALPYGGWGSCHASPNDWAMPPSSLPSSRDVEGDFDGEEWTRYLYPYSIMVNIHGQRFTDEAEDIRALTYAKMGRAILAQPDGKAFQIIDAKVRDRGLVPECYETATGGSAPTLRQLAQNLGIDPDGLEKTVHDFNAAVPGDVTADPNPYHTDGAHTVGLEPPKSNYAMTIDQPPFEGYVVRCGMTFTFGGVKIDPANSQVQHVAGLPIPGLYAAGEMVGGLWYWNYPSGSGMMAGATFGRRAGYAAAQYAKESA